MTTLAVGSAQASPQIDLAALAEAQLPVVSEISADFGALGVFRDSGRNVVMLPADRAQDREAVTSRLVGRFDAAQVEVRISRFTTELVEHLQEVAGTRAGNGISENYAFVSFYSAELDKYLIQSDAPAEVLEPIVAAHPGKVAVEQVEIGFDGRFDDIAPFYGAIAITDQQSVCTGGVVVTNPRGETYLTTAGHCFDLYDTISTAGAVQSTVGKLNFIARNRDAALIRVTGGSGRIWSGGYASSTSSLPVGGHANPYPGQTGVYSSGQTTFNQPNRKIGLAAMNFCPAGGLPCTTDGSGFSYTGGANFAGGDSGAPLYYLKNGKAIILGTHSGYTIDSRGRYTGFGTKISSVLSTFTLTLPTQ
ncbi:hypothetical protein [Lentzea flaviverrucosa]|uniref:hypothetical protein n=1 Tax=Lentzea flaviverrucosa TaxID=200379 RepID=UPI000B7C8C4F|nr:hypothetical protein [Lentzea flaviverrucosa]